MMRNSSEYDPERPWEPCEGEQYQPPEYFVRKAAFYAAVYGQLSRAGGQVHLRQSDPSRDPRRGVLVSGVLVSSDPARDPRRGVLVSR